MTSLKITEGPMPKDGMMDCGTLYEVGNIVDWWRLSGTDKAHWDDSGFKIVGFRGGPGNYMTVTAIGQPALGTFEIGSPQYRLHRVDAISIEQEEARLNRGPWKCFHCGESFGTSETAALHFGTHEGHQPLCTISPEHFRWMEAQHRRNCDEDSEALRAIGRLTSEHETLRRRAEELGYERGLRDAKKYPAELGLMPLPTEDRGVIPEGFEIAHVPPWGALTDEANEETRYVVKRLVAPFEGKGRTRQWLGPTLEAALQKALDDLGMNKKVKS